MNASERERQQAMLVAADVLEEHAAAGLARLLRNGGPPRTEDVALFVTLDDVYALDLTNRGAAQSAQSLVLRLQEKMAYAGRKDR
jgi:hypothetical protein